MRTFSNGHVTSTVLVTIRKNDVLVQNKCANQSLTWKPYHDELSKDQSPLDLAGTAFDHFALKFDYMCDYAFGIHAIEYGKQYVITFENPMTITLS